MCREEKKSKGRPPEGNLGGGNKESLLRRTPGRWGIAREWKEDLLFKVQEERLAKPNGKKKRGGSPGGGGCVKYHGGNADIKQKKAGKGNEEVLRRGTDTSKRGSGWLIREKRERSRPFLSARVARKKKRGP